MAPPEGQEIRTKTICFDESKWKSIDEIDEDTPASSASQIEQPGFQRKLASRINPFSKILIRTPFKTSLLWELFGWFA